MFTDTAAIAGALAQRRATAETDNNKTIRVPDSNELHTVGYEM